MATLKPPIEEIYMYGHDQLHEWIVRCHDIVQTICQRYGAIRKARKWRVRYCDTKSCLAHS